VIVINGSHLAWSMIRDEVIGEVRDAFRIRHQAARIYDLSSLLNVQHAWSDIEEAVYRRLQILCEYRRVTIVILVMPSLPWQRKPVVHALLRRMVERRWVITDPIYVVDMLYDNYHARVARVRRLSGAELAQEVEEQK